MGWPSRLFPRGENGLVTPGMLRGLKNQDQEAELGSMNLTGLGCANPTGLQQHPSGFDSLQFHFL